MESGQAEERSVETNDSVYSTGMSALEILCSVATYPTGNGAESNTGNKEYMEIEHLTESSYIRANEEDETRRVPQFRRPRRAGWIEGQSLGGHETVPTAPSNSNSSMSSGRENQYSLKTSLKQNSPASSGGRRSRRQSYTRFSPEEEGYLVEGVSQFGAGNWKKILMNYPFHCKRTPVDLKDKYRNMMRMRLKHKRKTGKAIEHGDHESDVSHSCPGDEETSMISSRTGRLSPVYPSRTVDVRAH